MYIPIIGLEIHIELKTKSKIFCSCLNDSNERHPNVNVCPICLGHPGVLPVINKEAIRKILKTGLAINCQISDYSKFDRKNYFYPDLPKGYQISQYDSPLCKEGYLEIPIIKENEGIKKLKKNSEDKIQNSETKRIKIRRIHLEEDTGRLIHEKNYSLVDFNRAGIPLMELVTEPDINSAKEARKFAEELQLILRYLNISEADMEKGQMRVEANISLIKANKNWAMLINQIPEKWRTMGTKVEIKNLNSFRALEKAIDYEIKRQREILKSGKKVIQETRGWDEVKGSTVVQRKKEEAQDYRYFPEPDLPPLRITEQMIQEIKAEIPELPQQKRERFKKEYGLLDKEIEIFTQNKRLGEYFEKVISELPPNLSKEDLFKLIKLTSNYLITDLQGMLKGVSTFGEDFLITPENFAEFIGQIYEGKISSKIAKIVLEEMFKTGADPSQIIDEKGLIQITDEKEVEKIIRKVIAKNQKAVEDFKKGKTNVFQFLVGKIMAESQGRASPKLVDKILKEVLTNL